jgi:hypothetical protein
MLSNKYSLRTSDYSWKNALLWGNFAEHCKKAKTGNCNDRFVHILIAIAEALPIISQIASIFEKLIATPLEIKTPKQKSPLGLPTKKVSVVNTTLKPKPKNGNSVLKPSSNTLEAPSFEEKIKAQIKAAEKIQNFYRKRLASRNAKKNSVKAVAPKALINPVLPKNTSTALVCEIEVEYKGNQQKEKVNISNLSDVQKLLKKASENIAEHHLMVEIYCGRNSNALLSALQDCDLSKNLQITISSRYDRCVLIQQKPIKVENLGDGKSRNTYASGVIETLTVDDKGNCQGNRIFPNGTKEQGKLQVHAMF